MCCNKKVFRVKIVNCVCLYFRFEGFYFCEHTQLMLQHTVRRIHWTDGLVNEHIPFTIYAHVSHNHVKEKREKRKENRNSWSDKTSTHVRMGEGGETDRNTWNTECNVCECGNWLAVYKYANVCMWLCECMRVCSTHCSFHQKIDVASVSHIKLAY